MKDLARQLRQQQTPSERLLWRHLHNNYFQGLKFRRQYVIGRYIVDFCCIEKKWVIEIDGEIHSEGDIPQRDLIRQREIEKMGYRVTLTLPSPKGRGSSCLLKECFQLC